MSVSNAFRVAVVSMICAAWAASAVTIDFEDGDTSQWMFVDEDPSNLGDVGPSAWEIRDAEFLDGAALYQGSNIWGSPADSVLLGTFGLYAGETFTDFVMKLDVANDDNDGIGLVWAFESTASHNRVILMNDRWPDVPLDGYNGPYAIAHTRIGDDEPWYDLTPLSVVAPPDYVNFLEGGDRMHWTLTVEGTHFTFESDHGLALEGDAPESREGMVGIQLYAHQAEFDNVEITSLNATAVDPAGKTASTWGDLKTSR